MVTFLVYNCSALRVYTQEKLNETATVTVTGVDAWGDFSIDLSLLNNLRVDDVF